MSLIVLTALSLLAQSPSPVQVAITNAQSALTAAGAAATDEAGKLATAQQTITSLQAQLAAASANSSLIASLPPVVVQGCTASSPCTFLAVAYVGGSCKRPFRWAAGVTYNLGAEVTDAAGDVFTLQVIVAGPSAPPVTTEPVWNVGTIGTATQDSAGDTWILKATAAMPWPCVAQ